MTKKSHIKVFICYAHADNENPDRTKRWLDRTLEHLKPIVDIDTETAIWSDRDIPVGSRWQEQLNAILKSADVAILLVSPAFLSSDFIKTNELPVLLKRAEEAETVVIPIIVRKCLFQEWEFRYPDPDLGPEKYSLSVFQSANPPDRPLNAISEAEQDDILCKKVTQRVLRIIQSSRKETASTGPDSGKGTQPGVTPPEPENTSKARDAVLIIGSGLIEDNLLSETPVELGYKHVVLRERYIGGSGVNFSIRLAKTGHPVLPIMSIGRDEGGKAIQSTIADAIKEHVRYSDIEDFVRDEQFLCKSIATSQTAIVIHKDERTAFTERVAGIEAFGEFMDERLRKAAEIQNIRVKAVMIGHLYADDPDRGMGQCLTSQLVERYKDEALVFANFGVSQIKRGAEFWKDTLSQLSVLQLTIQEALHLFENHQHVNKLDEMVRWFTENKITAVITHDKFGAVAVYRGDERVILGYPMTIKNLVDKTGAGDAFASGLVSALIIERDFDFFDLMRAINVATMWGAYACTKVGGSNESPTAKELKLFARESEQYHQVPYNWGDPQLHAILDYIDKKYGYHAARS